VTASNLASIALGAALVNNLVLARFLGVCPLLGSGAGPRRAALTGLAATLAIVVASAVAFAVNSLVLVPVGLAYLRTPAFVLAIAGAVWLAARLLAAARGGFGRSVGASLLPLATTCAVLGVALINVDQAYGLAASLVHGLASGLGFTLVAVLFAGASERVGLAPVPKALQGLAVNLILTGLVAIAFLGFSGLAIE
jgi:electron transport complex protein RnfA